MVIIWGTTHAGKVDEVPGGMMHVVTRFGHVYYIPLIPTGSYIVLEKTADGFRGADIPLSFKSILAGWLRGGSVVAILGACVGLALTLFDKTAHPMAWVIPVGIGCLATVTLILTYKLKFFTQASYERALELAHRVGLNDMGLLMLEVAYGRMNAEQAETELARRDAQQAALAPLEAQVLESPDGRLVYPS